MRKFAIEPAGMLVASLGFHSQAFGPKLQNKPNLAANFPVRPLLDRKIQH